MGVMPDHNAMVKFTAEEHKALLFDEAKRRLTLYREPHALHISSVALKDSGVEVMLRVEYG